MKSALLIASVFIALVVTGFGVAITWGGPDEVPPMPSINDPFKSVDYSDLPKPSYFSARDKTQLTYRAYSAGIVPVKGSVVLVHGSSASGISMHVMAKGMAAVGCNIYALDIRGHGESGTKGQIAYVGQLEDDIEDFTHAVKLAQPSTLTGFSAGGVRRCIAAEAGDCVRIAGQFRGGSWNRRMRQSRKLDWEVFP